MRKDIFCGCLIIFVLVFILSNFYCKMSTGNLIREFLFDRQSRTYFEIMMFELETVCSCVFGKTISNTIIGIIQGLMIMLMVPIAILITAIQKSFF